MSAALRGANGMGWLPGWAELEPAVPQIAAVDAPLPGPDRLRAAAAAACENADQALRCFAAFLARAAPEVTSIAQVTRPPRRGFQALAGRPPRPEQAAA